MTRHHRRKAHKHTNSCNHDDHHDHDDDFDDDSEYDDDEYEDDDESLFDEPLVPIRNETPKIGRNNPCPCGSGKKYKKCHINKDI